MVRADVYSSKGIKLSSLSLPKSFEEGENLGLLAQAIRVYEDRSHRATAKTKTRGEIARTKRKWYKQKGTGGARHGSRSAPIFVGGGVSHGPKPVKRQLSLPGKIRKKALNVALSLKAKNAEVILFSLAKKLEKTKDAQKFIDKVTRKAFKDLRGLKCTVALSDENWEKRRAFANIKNVEAVRFSDLNAYGVFFAGKLIIDREVFAKAKVAKVSRARERRKVRNNLS